MSIKYRLDNGRGTILVGELDTYVEEDMDRTAGWHGLPSETSVGHIDFIIDGGPVVTLQAIDGMPVGWTVEAVTAA